MFVQRFAVATNGGVVQDSRLVFHAGRCRGEEIVAIEGAHESVDRGFAGEMR